MVGLGRIFGSSNICLAMHECQISDTNFYPRTFGTFPNSSGDIMIYGQSDILSKYTDSFSLSSLNSTSMEGKILVKNPRYKTLHNLAKEGAMLFTKQAVKDMCMKVVDNKAASSEKSSTLPSLPAAAAAVK